MLIQVMGLNRITRASPSLVHVPGSRILEGRWGLEHLAIGIPQGRGRGMAYLRKFAEDAKSEGLVRRAAQRAGLRGSADPGAP